MPGVAWGWVFDDGVVFVVGGAEVVCEAVAFFAGAGEFVARCDSASAEPNWCGVGIGGSESSYLRHRTSDSAFGRQRSRAVPASPATSLVAAHAVQHPDAQVAAGGLVWEA